jgi:multidrug efflux system membrane fusion protein
VQAGPGAPVLTSIVSKNGIYADFEVDEQSYFKYVRNGTSNRDAEKSVPVKLIVGDATEYEGFIHSFDNRINVTSGTIRARALFANEDKALLPGMFASVKMGTPSKQAQIIISEKAIGTDQNRKFVYVVNDKNMVEYREVKIGESIKGQRVISSGLNEGDIVITEGVIRIRPGMPVDPQSNKTEEKPAE